MSEGKKKVASKATKTKKIRQQINEPPKKSQKHQREEV